jgi:NO-binding membrane sensor protein with MHYT domain
MFKIAFIIAFIAVFASIAWGIISSVFKKYSGIKVMLLGISLILFGGLAAIDLNSDLLGIEYAFMIAGLIISIIGFFKKENNID